MLEGSLAHGPPRAALQGGSGVSSTPQTSGSSSPSGHRQMPLDAGPSLQHRLSPRRGPSQQLVPLVGGVGEGRLAGWASLPRVDSNAGGLWAQHSLAWSPASSILPPTEAPWFSRRIRSALARTDGEEGGKVRRVKGARRTTNQSSVHSRAWMGRKQWSTGAPRSASVGGRFLREVVCGSGVVARDGRGTTSADPGAGRTVVTPKLPARYLKPRL